MAFDLRTKILNNKGQVVKEQPYRLYIDKGVKRFERPPGSGMIYAEDGSLMSEPKKEKMPASSKKQELEDLKQDLLSEE